MPTAHNQVQGNPAQGGQTQRGQVLLQDRLLSYIYGAKPDLQSIERLRSEGALINGVEGDGKPLKAVIINGKLSALTTLLILGADPNVCFSAHWDCPGPLHLAASMGNVECCITLIAAGADRSALNRDGQTPAQLAKAKHFFHATEVLDFPLHAAIDRLPGAFSKFLRQGYDLLEKGPDGQTALELALQSGDDLLAAQARAWMARKEARDALFGLQTQVDQAKTPSEAPSKTGIKP